MISKKLLLALTLLCATLSQKGFAALAPLWQGVREIEAIFKSEDFKEIFTSADQIQEIRKEGNSYYIQGTHHACVAEVVYLPSDRPGPAKFQLNFEVAPTPLEESTSE